MLGSLCGLYVLDFCANFIPVLWSGDHQEDKNSGAGACALASISPLTIDVH